MGSSVIAEKTPLRIFVSGTREDLGSCHVIVRDMLLSLGWEPVQELAPEDGMAREGLREKIAGCEAVVCLVGECYGPEAPQSISTSLRSFAQLEFDIAWELDKPVCIFLFAEDFPFDPHDPEPAERRILQQQHRIALCADDKPCLHIKDKDQLADRLKQLQPHAGGSRSDTAINPVEQSISSNEPRGAAAAPHSPAFQENVQFTAYRPKVIAPAKWTKMLVFAHLDDRPDWLDDDELGPIEEMQQEAARILGSKSDDYGSITSDSSAGIPEDGEITLVPEIDGIEFNPRQRAFLWEDGVAVHHETFDMRANISLNGRIARGRLTIFLEHIILAEITLSIRVDASHTHAIQSAPAGRASSAARPFRRVFTSYSHRDLGIVEATERYGRTLGDEYLRDLIYLRSGELWNDQLRELVRWADVFQLFWSSNSAQSKYVESEWRYALSLNRPAFVRPTYWHDPMPEPPEPLRGFHFHRLISGTQTDFLPPSMQSKLSMEPKLSPPAEVVVFPDERRFMPSSPADDPRRLFMPSSPIPRPNEPTRISHPSPTSWTLREKLIVGLVIAAVLFLTGIALLMRH
jgi:TIR domain/Domain of unknown function (DUF4062)